MRPTMDAPRPFVRTLPRLSALCLLFPVAAGLSLAGVITALYERQITGVGRLVEVAMQETIFPSLASSLSFLYDTQGGLPPRTGNKHGGLSIAPYNVYATADGHIAINVVKEVHWTGLLDAMGRSDLKSDPRFQSNASRVKHMAVVDGMVEGWTRTLPRDEVMAILKKNRIPSAPVRNLREVMNDPHMHQRGMLKRMLHPDLGDIVLPRSPINLSEYEMETLKFYPALGEHNREILGGMLGMSDAEIKAKLLEMKSAQQSMQRIGGTPCFYCGETQPDKHAETCPYFVPANR